MRRSTFLARFLAFGVLLFSFVSTGVATDSSVASAWSASSGSATASCANGNFSATVYYNWTTGYNKSGPTPGTHTITAVGMNSSTPVYASVLHVGVSWTTFADSR